MPGTERKGKRSAFPLGAVQVPPRPRLRLSVAFGMSAPAHTLPDPPAALRRPRGAQFGGIRL